MNDTKSSINTNDNSFLIKESETSFEKQTVENNDTLKTHIIDSIALCLEELIKDKRKTAHDIFYLSLIPQISLNEYIKNLIKLTNMNISTLIIAIIYIDRFCYLNNYILTINNIYRILISTCLLSLKFNQDEKITNKKYSEIVHVSIKDLKILEFQMYLKLQFSLVVEIKLYKKYFDYFSNYSLPQLKRTKSI